MRFRPMKPLTRRAERTIKKTIKIWEDKENPLDHDCLLCDEYGEIGCGEKAVCPAYERMPENKSCTDLPAWRTFETLNRIQKKMKEHNATKRTYYGGFLTCDMKYIDKEREKSRDGVVSALKSMLESGLKAREKR